MLWFPPQAHLIPCVCAHLPLHPLYESERVPSAAVLHEYQVVLPPPPARPHDDVHQCDYVGVVGSEL